LAICGVKVGGDNVHVGIFWRSEGEAKIIHFQNGNWIPVQEVTDHSFQSFLFNPIENFPSLLLPTLAGLAELISNNQLNGFIFNRVGVIFNGGKFEFQSGAFTGKSPVEKFVNCGVFVILLLNTFDHIILDWQTWPNVDPANLTFLDRWLNANGIAPAERHLYYNMTKAVRGKHVLVSPSTATQPSPYNEAEAAANALLQWLAP
jgi:hypothetical protein